MANIHQSNKAYEDWLRQQLGGDVVEDDLREKHDKMRESAFAFLRATYWRWAETVLDVCPEFADAPKVLSVGDIHLENFGTWRDAEGRLVWGVNDFDEAADMPYGLDLIRLATSALVAGAGALPSKQAGMSLLTGYLRGLAKPVPVVLDRDYAWLLALVAVSDKKRAKFWKKIEEAPQEDAPRRYLDALAAAMPQPGLSIATSRRVAGAGSLGRPRWVGRADWQGAPVVREAKALITSAWVRTHGPPDATIRSAEIANGRYRAHDPWFRVSDCIIVRRLSPNNRKIEADDEAPLSPQMLETMGLELANVHLGTGDTAKAIADDLKRRKDGWLAASAEKMAAAVTSDHKQWIKG